MPANSDPVDLIATVGAGHENAVKTIAEKPLQLI
jgi:hypothetical protein